MTDRKRKAPSGDATPSTSSKKIKLLNSTHPAAQNTVQHVGFKLLKQLDNATDKTGRSIVGAFLTLPARDDFPDYYHATRLPIAIDTIEDKLQRNAYPTITTIESDFKRMVQNAKDYNVPRSDIFEDAERIRKLVYNFMKVHNPHYNDPTYSSFPTPIPESNGHPVPKDVKRETQSRDGSAKLRLSLAPQPSEPPSERKSSTAPSLANEDDGEAFETDFHGKSFQEAQEMLVTYFLRYFNEEGLEIFSPFVNLPSRKIEDYYRLIKHPVSLKGVEKRILGQHGRNQPTGVTDFKSWDGLENEVSFIWRNAREYNEDGSDMFELAGEFEQLFKEKLAEAKEKVEEPAAQRIKLNATKPKSGITLNLSQHRNSPAPSVSVDSDSLARQRQMVQASVNGQQLPSRQPLVNGQIPARPQAPTSAALRATSAASPPVLPVKNELQPHSLAPAAPQTNGMMPPPMARPLSGSPYPGQPTHVPNSYLHYTAPAALPPTPIRTYPIEQALLPVVTLATHPHLRIPTPYTLQITPHDALSHQSVTITLPSTHYFLQISPTISRELSMGRAYKMFVTVNGTRLTQRDTQFHADSGKRTHVYEGSLASGVNRIEVEVAAAKADGKGLDVEKVTVYANLLRPV